MTPGNIVEHKVFAEQLTRQFSNSHIFATSESAIATYFDLLEKNPAISSDFFKDMFLAAATMGEEI